MGTRPAGPPQQRVCSSAARPDIMPRPPQHCRRLCNQSRSCWHADSGLQTLSPEPLELPPGGEGRAGSAGLQKSPSFRGSCTSRGLQAEEQSTEPYCAAEPGELAVTLNWGRRAPAPTQAPLILRCVGEFRSTVKEKRKREREDGPHGCSCVLSLLPRRGPGGISWVWRVQLGSALCWGMCFLL